jgi:hypothetical protein
VEEPLERNLMNKDDAYAHLFNTLPTDEERLLEAGSSSSPELSVDSFHPSDQEGEFKPSKFHQTPLGRKLLHKQ